MDAVSQDWMPFVTSPLAIRRRAQILHCSLAESSLDATWCAARVGAFISTGAACGQFAVSAQDDPIRPNGVRQGPANSGHVVGPLIGAVFARLSAAHRLSLAVYDIAPAPQHGQLMATRCSASAPRRGRCDRASAVFAARTAGAATASCRRSDPRWKLRIGRHVGCRRGAPIIADLLLALGHLVSRLSSGVVARGLEQASGDVR